MYIVCWMMLLQSSWSKFFLEHSRARKKRQMHHSADRQTHDVFVFVRACVMCMWCVCVCVWCVMCVCVCVYTTDQYSPLAGFFLFLHDARSELLYLYMHCTYCCAVQYTIYSTLYTIHGQSVCPNNLTASANTEGGLKLWSRFLGRFRLHRCT